MRPYNIETAGKMSDNEEHKTMLKNKIRSVVKKVYHKLNPQYKYILHINDVVGELQDRITALENRRPPEANVTSQSAATDALFLASDQKVYRYLYLLRYIREGNSVLDVEAEYGTGMDLLYRYTPVDHCLCLNSIDYYTRLGKMYYGSESVRFLTGSIYDIREKFDIITCLNEERSRFLDRKDWEMIYEMLEYDGILAAALDRERSAPDEIIREFHDIGFRVEKCLYQEANNPELTEEPAAEMSVILYLRKNG